MTLAGKLLVFVNLLLSFGMAAWGMGIYTQRVNWTNKGNTEAGQGELSKREDRIKALTAEVASAESRYNSFKKDLADRQQIRLANQRYYEGEIDRNNGWDENGQLKGATDQDPARIPVESIDPAKPFAVPTMEVAKDRANGNLRSYFAYAADILRTQVEIAGVDAKLVIAGKAAEDHSKEIVGTETAPGRRQLLANEETKLSKIEAEEERLKPLLINSYVEIQLLGKRNVQLKNQVEGLKSK